MEESRRRRQPSKVELGDTELIIVWRDDHVSRFPLEELRRGCPCATCREGRQSAPRELSAGPGGELPMLAEDVVEASAKARSFEYVGRYGIRINWADGHSHGIYTLEHLRNDDDCPA